MGQSSWDWGQGGGVWNLSATSAEVLVSEVIDSAGLAPGRAALTVTSPYNSQIWQDFSLYMMRQLRPRKDQKESFLSLINIR